MTDKSRLQERKQAHEDQKAAFLRQLSRYSGARHARGAADGAKHDSLALYMAMLGIPIGAFAGAESGWYMILAGAILGGAVGFVLGMSARFLILAVPVMILRKLRQPPD